MIRIAHSPIYRLILPEGHRFPMEKYELIPLQLLHEGVVTADNFFEPTLIEDELVLMTHDAEYYDKLKNLTLTEREKRAIGFPIDEHFVKRTFTIANGTMQCCHYAMEYGVAFNSAGGTHHSFADHGEGFCLLNDVGISSNYLLKEGLATQILVIDLDVHQGNGTAHLFRDEPRVFTFSVHGERNYPHRKEISDLDIEMPDGTGDEEYLACIERVIPELIERVKPDFIFYVAGVDVLETDRLGRLSLSPEGCKQRDKFVFETCYKHKIPLVVTMGGGYSKEIKHIVDAHTNTFKAAFDVYC